MAMTLTQLRHFVAVAETGQVSQAAERCHIAQPSMSTSLKNLEEGLGVALSRALPNGIDLTTAGERLFRHAVHILDVVRRAEADIELPTDGLGGQVTIGATETIGGYLIPSLLQRVGQRLPEVDIRMVEGERSKIEEGVMTGEIDFAIVLVSNVSRTRRLRRETLVQSQRRLWTSIDHPLQRQEQVTLADVAKQDFILLDMDEHLVVAEDYWRQRGLRPRVRYRSRSLEGVRSLVAQGLGVTILSDFVYRAWSHDRGRIRRRTLVEQVPTMDVGLVFRSAGEPPGIVCEVIRLLRRLA